MASDIAIDSAWRPLTDLTHERTVEFELPNGRIVFGRMLLGITNPGSRSYAWREHGKTQLCRPLGWREPLPGHRPAARRSSGADNREPVDG
jgi:hypothetical protein